MGFFHVTRVVILGASVVFSVIVLGLSAHLIALTEQSFSSYLIFCALGVATAGLTIATVPVMLFIDIMRRGAFTSMILVELIWLFVLWVLWVATAGEAVDASNLLFPTGCVFPFDPTINQACHEIQAIEAFSFLAFFTLLGYTLVLLIFSSIAAARGNSVWLSSVKESRFLAPAVGAQQPMSVPMSMPAQHPHPSGMPSPVPVQHYGIPA